MYCNLRLNSLYVSSDLCSNLGTVATGMDMTAPSISKHPKTIKGILKAPVVSLKRPKRENIPLTNSQHY